MIITQIKKQVLEMMRMYPESRDNDAILYFELLQLKYEVPLDARFMWVVKQIVAGELPPIESVRRNRQLIEKEYPELRGKGYDLRHRIKSEEVREEIINQK